MQGVAVAYDIRCFTQFPAASSSTVYSSIFPIVYTDEKFEAKAYIATIIKKSILHRMQSSLNDPGAQNLICMESEISSNDNTWDTYKVSLVKKSCHEYDAKWRIFLHGPDIQPPAFFEVKPLAVILGLKTSLSDKNLISSIACQAGIRPIYQTYVNSQGDLAVEPYLN